MSASSIDPSRVLGYHFEEVSEGAETGLVGFTFHQLSNSLDLGLSVP